MNITKRTNGTSIEFRILFLRVSLRKVNTLKEGKKYRCLLYQINRFENGYVSVYVRVFFKYSITIEGIKLKVGKRYFFGNKELI